MASELFEFEWRVCGTGYTWMPGGPKPPVPSSIREESASYGPAARPAENERFLMPFFPEDPAGGNVPRRTYHPLADEPGLFRIFADTPPTSEGILKFADRYGLLGALYGHFPSPADAAERQAAEPLSLWVREITLMRTVVDFWDLYARNDLKALARRTGWTGKEFRNDPSAKPDCAGYRTPDTFNLSFPEWISVMTLLPPPHQRYVVEGPRLAVFDYIQDITNGRLRSHLYGRMDWDEKTASFSLKMVPNHLLGALWLQFARYASENRSYRKCKECGKWFEISLEREGKRKNRRYCSDACRFKAYRERQARALELHARGMGIREIAEELDSTSSTVRGWIDHASTKEKAHGKKTR